MAIYAKTISNLTTDDLRELLDDKAVENVRLEFKREPPNKDEMMKKLSSFANTYGAWLIVGAEDAASDGRLTGFPGVEQQNSYKQKVVQWCFDNISPPIDVYVSDAIPAPGSEGLYCYVVYVPESELAPHFLNGRKGIYIRTDEYSQKFEPHLATLEEILRLTERRRLLLERRESLMRRASERFAEFVKYRYRKSDQANATDFPTPGLTSWLSYTISPKYPARRLWEPHQLYETLKRTSVRWRGTHFPLFKGLITQQDSALFLSPSETYSLLEANVWGQVHYSTDILDYEQEQAVIYAVEFIGLLIVFTRHAQALLTKAGYQGPSVASLELHNIQNIPWVFGARYYRNEGPGSMLDNQMALALEFDSEDLYQNDLKLIADMLKELFFALNWSEGVAQEESVRALIDSGMQYNRME